jgi:hypothetical protein
MRHGLEFLLGLLDERSPASLSREEIEGPHAGAIRLFRSMGFLGSEPSMNPVASCPHCLAGTPYPLGARYRCSRCGSEVDIRDLQLWRLDGDAFLRWLASALSLQGGVERIDDSLWRLGTGESLGHPIECFFLRGPSLAEFAHRRLTAYRSALVLHGKPARPEVAGFTGPILALAEILDASGESLRVSPLASLLRRGGAVSFDRQSGELRAGDVPIGRIPPGTREYHLVAYLADFPGEVITYSDLKRYVCAKTGSSDEADEATYCQKLKSRIKLEHGVGRIDLLIRSDRRGGGYLLCREVELPA